MDRKEVKPGEWVFREGQKAEHLYVVQSGKVEITRKVADDQAVIAVIGPGEVFGEMALLEIRPRRSSARATEPTALLVIPREAVMQSVDAADAIVKKVIQVLLNKLGQMTEAQLRNKTVVR